MTGAIVLITDVLFGGAATVVTGGRRRGDVRALLVRAAPAPAASVSRLTKTCRRRPTVLEAAKLLLEKIAELGGDRVRRRLPAQHLAVAAQESIFTSSGARSSAAARSPSLSQASQSIRTLVSLSAA